MGCADPDGIARKRYYSAAAGSGSAFNFGAGA